MITAFAPISLQPFLQPERVRVLPQAVSVCPDDAFDVAHFLRSLDGDQAKQVNECFYKKDAIPTNERESAPGQTSVPFNGPSSAITHGVPRAQSSLPRDVGYPLVVLIAGLRPVKVCSNHPLSITCALALSLWVTVHISLYPL